MHTGMPHEQAEMVSLAGLVASNTPLRASLYLISICEANLQSHGMVP